VAGRREKQTKPLMDNLQKTTR